MTSLAVPTAQRRRRMSTISIVVAAGLVLIWLAVALTWHDGLSTRTGSTALLLPPPLFSVYALVNHVRVHRRQRPVAFEVRDGAFVAPAADQVSAANAMLVLATGTVGATTFLPPFSANLSDALFVLGRIGLPLFAVGFLAQLAMLSRGDGQIMLRREGLRITYAFGSRDVPWEAVSAGPPRPVEPVEPTMRIGRPELLRGTGLVRRQVTKVRLPATNAWIQREFLADTINHYLAVPDARASIGTAEGHEHLCRVLRAG